MAQWAFLATSFLLAFRAFGITEPGYLGAVFLQSLDRHGGRDPRGARLLWRVRGGERVGLGLWGVDESRAVSFAIGFHILGWLTVTGLGAYYAARLDIRLRDLTRTEEKVETAVEADDPAAGRCPRLTSRRSPRPPR